MFVSMNNDIKSLAELEEMLVQEGEDGPTLCAHWHEVPIAQMRSPKAVSLPIIGGRILTTVEDVFNVCPHFGHRGCAHRQNNGTKVYENEIQFLFDRGLITEQQYHDLRFENTRAKISVGELDSIARRLAKENDGDPKKFLEYRNEIKERQLVQWKTIINPLRKQMLGILHKANSENIKEAA